MSNGTIANDAQAGVSSLACSLRPCPECGVVPEITGRFSENKKACFTDLRILHCCYKSPVWVDIESKTFTPGAWSEEQQRSFLAKKWNGLCSANTKESHES